jgi:hypothetical protein
MPPTESGPNVLEDGMDHGRAAGAAGVEVDRELGAVAFRAPSGATSVQGVVPASADLDGVVPAQRDGGLRGEGRPASPARWAIARAGANAGRAIAQGRGSPDRWCAVP